MTPASSPEQGKKKSIAKTVLQYLAFAFILCAGLGMMLGQDLPGGFILLLAAILLLPWIQKRLARTPLRKRSVTGIAVVVLIYTAYIIDARTHGYFTPETRTKTPAPREPSS